MRLFLIHVSGNGKLLLVMLLEWNKISFIAFHGRSIRQPASLVSCGAERKQISIIRAHSTTTKESNLQFWGAISTRLLDFPPVCIFHMPDFSKRIPQESEEYGEALGRENPVKSRQLCGCHSFGSGWGEDLTIVFLCSGGAFTWEGKGLVSRYSAIPQYFSCDPPPYSAIPFGGQLDLRYPLCLLCMQA